jgi:hypothetical protein
MATSTPWGPSQTSHEIARGIRFYSTASHGGYCLSRHRFATFRECFPHFTLCAGDPWFEEDCDSALVTITFAEEYSDESVFFAEQSIRASVQREKLPDGHWHQVWTTITENQRFGAALQRAADFRRDHAEDWQVGCAGTNGDGWKVLLTRLKDGAQHWKSFPDYPDKSIYSSTEVFG